jgi:hypothetical protein
MKQINFILFNVPPEPDLFKVVAIFPIDRVNGTYNFRKIRIIIGNQTVRLPIYEQKKFMIRLDLSQTSQQPSGVCFRPSNNSGNQIQQV